MSQTAQDGEDDQASQHGGQGVCEANDPGIPVGVVLEIIVR